MRRTLAFTALALTALALASCQTWTSETTLPQGRYVQAPPAPTPLPGKPTALPPRPVPPVPQMPITPEMLQGLQQPVPTAPGPSPQPASTRAADPLDVRRCILEKKAKLLTLEAQKVALEKSLRDLRAEIAAVEKKLDKGPKKKTKPTSAAQAAPPAGGDQALARKLEAVLKRLERLEKAIAPPAPAPVSAAN